MRKLMQVYVPVAVTMVVEVTEPDDGDERHDVLSVQAVELDGEGMPMRPWDMWVCPITPEGAGDGGAWETSSDIVYDYAYRFVDGLVAHAAGDGGIASLA